MSENLDSWLLSRNRTRRTVNPAPRAAQSQQQLSQSHAANARREYGQEICARVPPADDSNSFAYDVGGPVAHMASTDPMPDDDGATQALAEGWIRQLYVRDGHDARGEYETGQLPLLTLRDQARAPHRSPSPGSGGDDVPPDYVYESNPEPSTGQATTANHTAPVIPTAGQGGRGPIATDTRGNNAWPGITVDSQEGNIVRSRFAGDGYDPPPEGYPFTHSVPAPPLRRTDAETIVPGTPQPQPPVTDKGKAPLHPVRVSQTAQVGAPTATTHSQTNLGRVLSVQSQPSAMVAPMTPSVPRPRKGVPPIARVSHPVAASDASQTSAPVPTPTPTAGNAPRGTTVSAANTNHIGNNSVRSGHTTTGITFSNSNISSNATAPPGFRSQATREAPGAPRPYPIQQPIVSTASNPFYIQPGFNVARAGSMADRPMPLLQNQPPVVRNDVPVATQLAQLAQSAQCAPIVPLPPASLPMADRPMPMVSRVPPVTRNDVPAAHQAALLAQSAQFAGLQVPPYPHNSAIPPHQAPVPHTYGQRAPSTQYAYTPNVGLSPENALAAQYEQGLPYMEAPQYPQAPQAAQPALFVPPELQVAPEYQTARVNQQLGFPPIPPVLAPAGGLATPIDPHVAIPQGSPMDLDVGNGGDGIAAAHANGPVAPARENFNNQPFRPSNVNAYPLDWQPVVRSFVRHARIWRMVGGTYKYDSPNKDDKTPTHEQLGALCWKWANKKHGTNHPFTPDLLKPVDASVCAARSAAKSALLSFTQKYFGLTTEESEHNKEVKESVLPHGIHYGIPEEKRKPMESEYLKEGTHLVAFQSKNGMGFRFRELFGPPSDRFLAFLCTLGHHIIYCHGGGKFVNQYLNATQQGAVFAVYMDMIEGMRKRKPGDLFNLRMRIYDYCMRCLVDPDPRPEIEPPQCEWSPDATELVTSEFATYLPADYMGDAPVLGAQQGRQAGEVLPELEEEDDAVSWEVITTDDGALFLVGSHNRVQIDRGVFDDLAEGHISVQEVLELGAQLFFPPEGQPLQLMPRTPVDELAFDPGLGQPEGPPRAGPSGLSNAEKEDVAASRGTCIEVVDSDEEEPQTPNQEPADQISSLYNGRYLDQNGGVELDDDLEDEDYFAEVDPPSDFEPAPASDEEMELYPDD